MDLISSLVEIIIQRFALEAKKTDSKTGITNLYLNATINLYSRWFICYYCKPSGLGLSYLTTSIFFRSKSSIKI